MIRKAIPVLVAACAGCGATAVGGSASAADSTSHMLSTGRRLDPAGGMIPVGNMPLAAATSLDGRYLFLVQSGWREQGVQVVDTRDAHVTQTIAQPGAFLGIAVSHDGHDVFVSGAAADVVYRYAWDGAQLRLTDSIAFPSAKRGSRFIGGLALSPDGTMLYTVENLDDSLAVVRVASGEVVQRVPTAAYPYGVVVSPDGHVYVSAWGDSSVSVFEPNAGGRLSAAGAIRVSRHPSAMVLNKAGTRLYVTSSNTDRIDVVDTRSAQRIATLTDAAPAGPAEGSTPNALQLSPDEHRLFVAEADNNAVAVFDVDSGRTTPAGRVPVMWYPAALAISGDALYVVNAKGRGAGPNPGGPRPNGPMVREPYTLGQLNGTVSVLPLAFSGAQLDAFSQRVSRANGWDVRGVDRRGRKSYPPFEHVMLVIKENRTYDQILGDLPRADGDTSLVFFPRAITPNHHALAERFGTFDRFFVNAEVSAQGHPWTTSAYATEYTEKNTPSIYADKRDPPDRGADDDVELPAMGFIWEAAARRGLWVRNYGEYAAPDSTGQYHVNLLSLDTVTSHAYPSFDLRVRDQRRADVWLSELADQVKGGRMPALEIMHLPGDHLAGVRKGMCTPNACMADNDLALGRIVEALSASPFWKSTVMFVVEDDAQAGPDHVDSHRSVALVISAYSPGGVLHRFVNTTDVLATIEDILGLDALSQFDYYGRPLRDIWRDRPDLAPYHALLPAQPLDAQNVAMAPGSARSATFDFTRADAIDDDAYNRVLWTALKGKRVPYPAAQRVSLLDDLRNR